MCSAVVQSPACHLHTNQPLQWGWCVAISKGVLTDATAFSSSLRILRTSRRLSLSRDNASRCIGDRRPLVQCMQWNNYQTPHLKTRSCVPSRLLRICPPHRYIISGSFYFWRPGMSEIRSANTIAPLVNHRS